MRTTKTIFITTIVSFFSILSTPYNIQGGTILHHFFRLLLPPLLVQQLRRYVVCASIIHLILVRLRNRAQICEVTCLVLFDQVNNFIKMFGHKKTRMHTKNSKPAEKIWFSELHGCTRKKQGIRDYYSIVENSPPHFQKLSYFFSPNNPQLHGLSNIANRVIPSQLNINSMAPSISQDIPNQHRIFHYNLNATRQWKRTWSTSSPHLLNIEHQLMWMTFLFLIFLSVNINPLVATHVKKTFLGTFGIQIKLWGNATSSLPQKLLITWSSKKHPIVPHLHTLWSSYEVPSRKQMA